MPSNTQNTKVCSMLLRKPRHNLKFNKQQKQMFKSPHDMFVDYLLSISPAQYTHLKATQCPLSPMPAEKQKPWTVWVSKRTYARFIAFRTMVGLSSIHTLDILLYLANETDHSSFALFRVAIYAVVQVADSSKARLALKLSKVIYADQDFKLMFSEPYDCFLDELIETTSVLAQMPLSSVQLALLLKQSPKGTSWTIWTSPELKQKFLDTKKRLCPGMMHTEFVYLMLTIKLNCLGKLLDTGVIDNATAPTNGLEVESSVTLGNEAAAEFPTHIQGLVTPRFEDLEHQL